MLLNANVRSCVPHANSCNSPCVPTPSILAASRPATRTPTDAVWVCAPLTDLRVDHELHFSLRLIPPDPSPCFLISTPFPPELASKSLGTNANLPLAFKHFKVARDSIRATQKCVHSRLLTIYMQSCRLKNSLCAPSEHTLTKEPFNNVEKSLQCLTYFRCTRD